MKQKTSVFKSKLSAVIDFVEISEISQWNEEILYPKKHKLNQEIKSNKKILLYDGNVSWPSEIS